MNEVTLNCENLPCPKPVILTRQLLDGEDAPSSLRVVVDNEAALENVSRFLASRGYASSHSAENGLFTISADKSESGGQDVAQESGGCRIMTDAENASTLLLVLSPVVGSGDDVLGAKLMKNFLATLPELGESLWRVILLNGGVTLSTADSHVITELQALESAGTSILVCGACLEHFGILGKKAVGQTTNMLDVVTSIQLADKVIRI